MVHLRSLSVMLVVVGFGLLVSSLAVDLGPTWTLTGLLLAWAGIVKVVVMRLWRGLSPDGGLPTGSDDREAVGSDR